MNVNDVNNAYSTPYPWLTKLDCYSQNLLVTNCPFFYKTVQRDPCPCRSRVLHGCSCGCNPTILLWQRRPTEVQQTQHVPDTCPITRPHSVQYNQEQPCINLNCNSQTPSCASRTIMGLKTPQTCIATVSTAIKRTGT
jgi:hypothetical protein